jgi:Rad3-related DNA helicase
MNIIDFPSPSDLGAVGYSTWRHHQPSAILSITDTDKRFVGSVLPTGAGKTLTVVGAALLAGRRTAFLTSTKLLQEQYLRDMATSGMVEVKGQANYECIAFQDEHRALRDKTWHGCDEGPCRAGLYCTRKPTQDEGDIEKGCLSYDAVARARRSRLVVTNYKYWMHANRFRPELGRFDCLVLDEAHHAPTELADFLSTRLDAADMQLLGSGGPRTQDSAGAWADWAKSHEKALRSLLEERPQSRAELRKHRHASRVANKLSSLVDMAEGDWVIQSHNSAWHFDPVWVANYKEKLFRGIPHIVFTSATFTHKTAAMLGVGSGDLEWHEAPSDFPVARRPVYFCPTVKLDYRADESQVRLWLATVDNFLRRRRDRKGIIHAVSYERAKLIRRYSEFAPSMILNEKWDTKDRVAEFRSAGPGAIFVSPSVTTGYDFAGAQCEYQVIAKIPFPDRRNPVTAARTAHDPEYPAYIAMQELVQAVGRGMRSADDQCETIILDSNASWFMRKHRDLAPDWFMAAYQRVDTLPDPLPALAA